MGRCISGRAQTGASLEFILSVDGDLPVDYRRVGFWLLFLPLVLFVTSPPQTAKAEHYRQIVVDDDPVAYWTFADFASDGSEGNPALRLIGDAVMGVAGPRSPDFPLFAAENEGLAISKAGSVRVADPGADSPFDFTNGDSLTLEAWVAPRAIPRGQHAYVIGKGRTLRAEVGRDNQNYALRLTGNGSTAAISFLFRSAGDSGDWHRWSSGSGLVIGDGWHHVAVSYTFGDPASIRGYIDGEPVTGRWDMGGATRREPVVDDDEIWIGSSMGGSQSSTFQGQLDEVAIYRQILPEDRLRLRYKYAAAEDSFDEQRIPAGQVLVDLLENIPDGKSWRFRRAKLTDSYHLPAFGFVDVPNKYSPTAVKVDRSNPFLLRAAARVTLPRGKHRILVRCRNASRLYLDGQRIAETPFHSIPSSGHGKVYPLDDSLAPNIRPLRRGDTQQVVEIEGDGKPHLFRFEMIVGGSKHRPELGETSVSIGPLQGDFQLLSPQASIPLTNAGWSSFAQQQRATLQLLNAQTRREAGRAEQAYWDQRHRIAKAWINDQPPISIPTVDAKHVNNAVDQFIAARLEEAGVEPSRLTTDAEFVRRVTVDVLGTIPSPEQIRVFSRDTEPGRRARFIDRLLESDRWADNWVGYWQDVLAENPNIVNPTLNNTGPFRWWIHESFLDNKPFDRFATELIMMEGSVYYGGPAGFGMATQNDAPMAAKAHIVGQAFLGLEMKCARCHDAPYHDFRQEDLFSLAAMLKRSPQQVPKTSSIPGGADAVASLLVEVTLKPGTTVEPAWTFGDRLTNEIPAGLLRTPDDSRERLAALVTSPANPRFARVIVNRLWRRYLGRGLVEPVDDWEDTAPSHPELLDYLGRELVRNDYDLKHVARLILNSQTYQRAAWPGNSDVPSAELFAAPLRRRMSAEQLVDSLFAAAGKPFDAGPVCIDTDGARPPTSSLNLGEPTRAWQFASLSNERDRPSLALPFAQPFVTLMETYGWRSSRQDPLSCRMEEPTVLQPAIMTNGILSRRITRLSNDSAFTDLVLEDHPLHQLIDQVHLRLLSRTATAEEQQLFGELLGPGYASRQRPGAANTPGERHPMRGTVSWSNHLHPQANVVKTQLESAVRQGDPPTGRLEPDWRERMEDMIWSLINSPEFVFLP
jgi:hypothetical protein